MENAPAAFEPKAGDGGIIIAAKYMA